MKSWMLRAEQALTLGLGYAVVGWVGVHDVTARQKRIAEGPQQTFVSTSQDDTTRQHVDDDTTPR